MEKVWNPIPTSELERYLTKHTRNPYYANILTSLALKNGNVPIHVEEGIEKIEKLGLEGAIECSNAIRTANAWPAGTGRGWYLVGRYRAQHELDINPRIDTVCSIGSQPGSFNSLNREGLDSNSISL